MIKGIICIILGIVILWVTYKYPAKERNVGLPNLNGVFAGIGFIILGLALLFNR